MKRIEWNEGPASYLELAVDYAVKAGVDVIIVKGIDELENQIRFSMNKINVNKIWLSRKIEFVVVVDGNRLVTGDFSPVSEKDVKDEIDRAIRFAGEIDPNLLYSGIEERIHPYPVLKDTFDRKIDDFVQDSPGLINMTIDEAIRAGAKRVAGTLLFGKKSEAFISSAGPKGNFLSNHYNLTVRAFQDELDSSGQGLACGRSISNVSSEFEKAGQKAGELSKAHSNCKQGKPGIYDLVLSPVVGASLLGSGSGLLAKTNPVQILIGMSPFQDKMGERIAPEFVNVSDNPLIQDGLESAPFDFEGTPHGITSLITGGVLTNLIHNTSTANLFDTTTTGNSALADVGTGSRILVPTLTNLVFDNGDHSLDELFEGNKPTLYITCNWYTRFTSEISTEFSSIPRDAMFVVEKGELGQPIKNVRISDNLVRMLKNVTALGNDRAQVKWWIEVTSATWIPTVRISDCRITTATK